MDDNYTNNELKRLHKVLLEILDQFVKICDKYHLTYSLGSGTLLGAVRHSGFIPWDDDIDVLMPRKDYEEFIKVAQKELGEKYFLDCFEKNPEYHLQFAKIKKNNTIFDEEGSHHMNNHKGIFVDIFPVDNVFDNIKRSYLDAALIKMIISTMYVKNKVVKIKDTKHWIIVSFLSLFSKKRLMKIEKWLCTRNKNHNSRYIACFLGIYPFKKELIERVDFFPLKKITFEGKKYFVMNNYDKYLTNIYGNYMELPPKEKRVAHRPLKIDFGDNNED